MHKIYSIAIFWEKTSGSGILILVFLLFAWFYCLLLFLYLRLTVFLIDPLKCIWFSLSQTGKEWATKVLNVGSINKKRKYIKTNYLWSDPSCFEWETWIIFICLRLLCATQTFPKENEKNKMLPCSTSPHLLMNAVIPGTSMHTDYVYYITWSERSTGLEGGHVIGTSI